MNKISTIFFDAGNTIVLLDHEIIAAAAGISDASKIEEGDRKIRPIINMLFEENKLRDFAFEYYGGILSNAGISAEQIPLIIERIKNAEKIFPIWRRINPEARPAVEELKKSGCKIAVISNSDGRAEMLLKSCAVSDLFEFVLDSHIEGVEKPSAEFFLRAAKRLNVIPETCIYVGDIPSVDVRGAKNAGMLPILYDPLDAWQNWTESPRINDLREIKAIVDEYENQIS